MAFKRTIENFICERCGAKVSGNGYTNHCPFCLWSKHVDMEPGDRANLCGGMMRPAARDFKDGEYIIIHRCEKCGQTHRNKLQKEDNFEVYLTI
ncbi:RNHCP domain-containing protein [Patescibacteria group bacterium]|nr:RNHCP domain-containing protein [Patescibacteria group bacterium]